MQIAPQQGWSTLREGSQYYLYRSASHISLSTLESFIQRMQECQNEHIAIPELVRLADGEVYLREPRGQRSFEDFLNQDPSTPTKLFLIQQLVKLLRNLQTFVGTEHGNLHIECLSIGLDDELVLGGVSPQLNENSTDLEATHQLIRTILSKPLEQDLCADLCQLNLSRMNQRIKRELATGNWDDLVSDWTETVNNTTYEEPSDELSLEESVATPTPSTAAVEDTWDSWSDLEATDTISAADLEELDFLDELDLDDVPAPSFAPRPNTANNESTSENNDEPNEDALEATPPTDKVPAASTVFFEDDDGDVDLEDLLENIGDDDDMFDLDGLDDFDDTEMFERKQPDQESVSPIDQAQTRDNEQLNVPNVSKDDLTNNVFSQDSLLGTLDVAADDLSIDDDVDDMDWFNEPTATLETPPPVTDIETATTPVVSEGDAGNQAWVWAAGVAVVAGGVFAVFNRDTTPPPEVVVGNAPEEVTETPSKAVETEAALVTTEPVEQTPAEDVTNNAAPAEETTPTEISLASSAIQASDKQVADTEKAAAAPSPFQQNKPSTATSAKITAVQDLPAPAKKPASTKPSEPKATVASKPAIQTTETSPAASSPVAPKKTAAPQKTTAPKASAKTNPAVAKTTPIVTNPEPTVKKAAAVQAAKPKPPTVTTTPAKPVVVAKEDIDTTAVIATKLAVENVQETTAQAIEKPAPTEPAPAVVAETIVEKPSEPAPKAVEVAPAEPIVQVNEPTTVDEPVEVEPVTPTITDTIPRIDLSAMAKKAFSATLTGEELSQLSRTPQASPDFTRANAIVLTQAQKTNDAQRIGESLENILSVAANTHKPVYLLAMAQYQFNIHNFDGAREYLLQAENNWQHVERDQLMILRAQRDNIVAHMSYTTYLETGSEDARLQSITQFRKVQREARRAKLGSMFERAESKMQALQRKAQ